MTREEKIMKAARVYANGIAQHSLNKKYCEEDFIAGAEWADAHPHWISVEDDLPKGESEYDEFSEIVLATDGKDVYESRYHIEYNTWYTRNMFVFDDVSHWMPLPSVEHLKKGGEE